ncbi:hypothetical protein OIU91_20300 [Streptomyces sp. NBC_01456]|uniref:hypothetical protein n=1 Tax=unclassified Streptomyces TaxID=2593676 RepID=UPI002E34843E|nr:MULTISPECIES: hypothetical protein [unclassified Streptomyces]
MTSHEDENGPQAWPKAAATTDSLRLLTWHSPSGNRCYLSTDDANSNVARLADNIEKVQTDAAEQVLDAAMAVLEDPHADAQSLRFALRRMREALVDVLLVAESRGGRLPILRDKEEGQDPEEEGPKLPPESF